MKKLYVYETQQTKLLKNKTNVYNISNWKVRPTEVNFELFF